ncbi:N-acylphosphatidylethanolamine synthase isoform X2 [Dioscorea cayenensis subsp. rotundata]|uniref:Tafazzin family protein n=1 Tax=Dioscorea cayennensis subsp. rotundata TaxID=55577 RepID=A0AB40BD90_DIOCR|nr:N-acylphosphatidylethanolamine synthase isoform X2 [Dioscorea cayenensis subsp. rotundata]
MWEGASTGERMMRWAARAEHLAGLPRRVVVVAVGAFAKVMTTVLNSTHVHNPETLIRLVRSRPSSVPLLTVSNHMSTLDDPLMWGFKGFPSMDAKLARWVLAAEDICFKNRILSYLFRLGKCIPVTRGGGIYQEQMSEALDVLNGGEMYGFLRLVITIQKVQLHTFPEGKVNQEDVPVRRLKWGTASLIVRAPVTPIVLPIFHSGFEKVMPEKACYGRRPPLPLCMKDIKIIIGEPIEFDLWSLRQTALTHSCEENLNNLGWPKTSPDGLNEAAQRWLFTSISDQIRTAMEKLRTFDASAATQE